MSSTSNDSSRSSSQKPFKWAEISLKKSQRFEVLSTFLNENGIANEFRYIPYESQDLKTIIETAKKENESLRFGFELWDSLEVFVQQHYSEVLRLNCVDALYFDEKGGWWPHLSFDQVVSYSLSHIQKKLITTDPVLVIGAQGLARSAIQGLIQLGFSKINIACDNEPLALKMKEDLEKMFFNTEFSYTPRDRLTLLPGVHAVVFNTLAFPEKEEFLKDLYYFNFLKKNSVVIDINETPLETPLIFIAEDIHAKAVRGFEILCHSDSLWYRNAFKHEKALDWAVYKQKVLDHLTPIKVADELIQGVLQEFQIKS